MDYNLREEFDLLLNQVTNKIEIIKEIGIPLILNDTCHILEKIRNEIKDCHKCVLADSRNQAVSGEGSSTARLVFVSDFPGEESNNKGKFYLGNTGKLLNKIIEVTGIDGRDVYVTNAIKCFVPENHKPDDKEIESCREFLFKELERISPVLICAMGEIPIKAILNIDEKIKDMHGKNYFFSGIKVIPTFSLNDCLINEEHKRLVWEDIKVIMKILNLPFKNVLSKVK
ncbi:uracil-DNA glycosylase [Candidatus Desantisbacteria bacterium]|nr:uracil-DNA glycosylase [Candidatus Desantisbacteria bacterium]